jgi:AraC-like DNA-binding protein
MTGRARGIAGGHSFDQTAGSLLFSDVGQTSLHESTGSRSIMLSMSRGIALELGLDVQAMHGTVVSSQAAVMFASHLQQILRAAPELGQDDMPRLSRTVLDLLALAVGASGRSVRLSGDSGRLAALRARDEIERRLGSPTLGIADLCRRLQISRSSLHRLFAEEGGVQAYIRGRRLEAARTALLDPGNGETVGAIAERLGFSDTAHLSRLFRARYGETPSDCRAAALDGDR